MATKKKSGKAPDAQEAPQKEILTQELTHFPASGVAVDPGGKPLKEGEWTSLANDLWNSIIQALAARDAMELNEKEQTDLYEMYAPPTDVPFENASNLFIPIIPAKLDSLLAQLVAKTLLPEFILVSGNTADAQSHAYEVQRYMNTELRRQRGDTTRLRELVRWMHLGLLYGTGIMEAMWKKDVRKVRYRIQVPETDARGLPVMDDETGEVKTKPEYHVEEVVYYNAVEWRPVWLRDFLFMPGESFSVNQAAAVARCIWLYESDLEAMIKDGILRRKWVEAALAYVPQGESDATSDRQGNWDKDAGGQLNVGLGQGTLTSKFFKNRGPLKVWRIHSYQYDMNDDTIPEENFFYMHDISGFMLGWEACETIVPSRPFFLFTPLPRPDRPYGFPVPQRLGPINAEVNTLHNQRNNEITMRLSPPWLFNDGLDIKDKKYQWGPAKKWSVQDVDKSVKMLQMQDIPLASWQEESGLNSYADQLIGQSAPMSGGTNSGRKSAAEVKISTMSSGTRADLIAFEFRLSARALIEYTRSLELQYPQELEQTMQRASIDPGVYGMDFNIDVAGSADPIDANAHLQETLAMYNLFRQDQDVQGDAMRRYALKKMVLEAFRARNIDAILGTAEEAAQRKQSEQQQQAEAMQLQKQLLIAKIRGGGQGGPSGDGKPPGGPPQQQQQQPEPAGVAA